MTTRRTFAVLLLGGLVSLSASSGQGPDLDRVMHRKLAHAQKVLEAVVTSDWVLLETESRELERLTYEPGWAVMKAPEYAGHSLAFRRSIQMLHEAAAKRDMEAAPKAYITVTLSCVECHRYVGRSRIATAR